MPRAALLLALLALAACDDPTALRQAPPLEGMTLFLVVDPDAPSQPLLVKSTGPSVPLAGLAGTVFRGDALVERVVSTGSDSRALSPCVERFGIVGARGGIGCLNHTFRPEPGATYRLSVTARDQPTATATVTVPGDFRVLAVAGAGSPLGTEGLEVRWTRSAGAYRYVVALRASRAGDAEGGWYAATADTALQAVVPREAYEGGSGPWYVDVYAMERAAFEHLTTGAGAELFPVPPKQNVEGGYGAVGAWVRRSARLQ